MQWTGEHDEGECRDGMREGWRRDSGDHNKCFQQPILDLFRTGLLCMVACITMSYDLTNLAFSYLHN